MVDNFLSSYPHLICSPFLAIVEDMVYQGTAQPLVLIMYIIYIIGVAFSSPVTSPDARSTASLSYTLFAYSTHVSVEL